MNKPTQKEFGWESWCGWEFGDLDGYMAALKEWQTRPRKSTSGRQRTRPIHPSWNTVLQHFNPSDPTRSQGAFCRWADLNRATFSAMQCKSIPMHIVELIGAWNAQGKEVENE